MIKRIDITNIKENNKDNFNPIINNNHLKKKKKNFNLKVFLKEKKILKKNKIAKKFKLYRINNLIRNK